MDSFLNLKPLFKLNTPTTARFVYLNNSDLLVEVRVLSLLEQVNGAGFTGAGETFRVGDYCGYFRTLPLHRTLAVFRYVHPA